MAKGDPLSIWYVVNLATRQLVATFSGTSGGPPRSALRKAEATTQKTGDTCVVALGKVWTQLP